MRHLRLLLAYAVVFTVAVFSLNRASTDSVYWDTDFPYEFVLNQVGTAAGQYVADVGCSTGEFTVEIGRRVGNKGKVLAQDIDDEKLEAVRRKIIGEKLSSSISLLKGQPDNPMLPDGVLDTVYLTNAYHEMEHYESMLAHIRSSLKPGGVLVVIDQDADYDEDISRKQYTFIHYLPKQFVKKEAAQAGFELVREVSAPQPPKTQFYFLIFRRR